MDDFLKFITVVIAVVMLSGYGISTFSRYQTEVNQIERICYERGGHMTAAPGSSYYFTCKGPNNQWAN
jgi:hypothetical protein